MNDQQIAALKADLKGELTELKKRCTSIENLLRSLDDYHIPIAPIKKVVVTPTTKATSKVATAGSDGGPTAMQRAANALLNIPEPFTLVQLRDAVNKDGLSEMGRGNWGLIVQKLKKKGMIECCEGEEGKPGALYKHVASKESAETSPTEEGA